MLFRASASRLRACPVRSKCALWQRGMAVAPPSHLGSGRLRAAAGQPPGFSRLMLHVTPQSGPRVEGVARHQRIPVRCDHVKRRDDAAKFRRADEVVEVHARPARL